MRHLTGIYLIDLGIKLIRNYKLLSIQCDRTKLSGEDLDVMGV